MEDRAIARKRFRLSLLLGIAVPLLLIGGLVWAWQARNSTPPITLPNMPQMPKPNALDSYLLAAKAIPYPIPTPSSDQPISVEQRRELFAKRAEITRLFVQGSGYSYRNPPITDSDDRIVHLRPFRNLARYCALLAEEDAAAGKWGDAMAECQRALRLGDDMQQGAIEITALAAISVQSIGRRSAWQTISHLNVEEARAAIAEMERINAAEVPFADILRHEKYTALSATKALWSKPNWQEKLIEETDFEKGEERLGARMHLMLIDKRETLALLEDYFAKCIAMSEGPFIGHPSDPPLPNDLLVLCFAPICEKTWVKMLANSTANRQLTVLLALHAYHLEKGQYPRKLEDLVRTGNLTMLPADPFADGAPLKYHGEEKRFLLYSIGPDGKDDGGKPIAAGMKDPRPEDLGDIVAGVNIY